jgi:hypothetical protein
MGYSQQIHKHSMTSLSAVQHLSHIGRGNTRKQKWVCRTPRLSPLRPISASYIGKLSRPIDSHTQAE